MADPSPLVVCEVIRAIGQIGDLEHVPWLLERLADRTYRVEARDALAAFGPEVLGVLVEHLDSEETDPRIRRSIPRVINEIRTQESVNILLARVDRMPLPLSYPLIKALNKLRANGPDLAFDPQRVGEVLFQEARSLYEMVQIRHLLRFTPDEPSVELLRKALSEKQERHLEHIFRLLALRYPPDDIYHAYLGTVSSRRALRANAIEFLDNLLERDQKAYLLPFLDPVSDEVAVEEGRRLFHRYLGSREEALAYLIRGKDAWLRACAINCVNGTGSEALVNLVVESRVDPDPLVAETAELVIRNRGAWPQ
jgi:AAA family ATP:ADP antiporter